MHYARGWVGLALLSTLAGPIGPSPAPASAAESARVSTRQGVLLGSVDAGVRRFLGIPYAAAPVGPLRFRAPAAPRSWSGVRDARSFGPVCPQVGFGAGAPATLGEEDCLNLNVYAPAAARGEAPVLVWIHGGGRRLGDGRRDPSAFVRDTGVVVVSIQYRLDHLALLAHPALTREDPARLASGNYGFQDAIAALRWVQAEVRAFGGDPGRVTIAGLSGGGTMVCGLLVSPAAAGLFHGAIVQSAGGCWFPTESIEVGERRGLAAAERLGCPSGAEAAACLRALPASAFFREGILVENPFAVGSPEWFGAQPILGGRSGQLVDGSVFPRSWPQALALGAFQPVPLIIGVTQHEGRRVYADLLYGMGFAPLDAAHYPRALHGLTGSPELGQASAAAFPLDAGAATAAERFADVATEAHYTCPHAELAGAVARHVPTWLYEFRVPGPRKSDRIELGAYHGADTELLFGADAADPLTDLGVAQADAAKRLRAYVGSFVRRGDPNADDLPRWPAHAGEGQHLDFGTRPQAATGLRQRACRHWRGIGWQMLPQL